jgi:hypothetical protein
MKALFLVISVCLIFSCKIQAQSYWQQKVEYKIDVFLDVDSNVLSGKESVRYFNNSPDTLMEIYLHLYWNAFKPGSYMNLKSISVNRENGKRISNLKADEQGNVVITNIQVDGSKVISDEHDTILKLKLNKPLLPNNSIKIDLDFKSQVPKLVRRAGRDNQQSIRYSIAQWYPKICEYDNEGWHNDEYAGREFFGIWGNFDVKITLDANYILGSTGIIQNPKEVKCGYDLFPFDTSWCKNENESYTKGSFKTWHFKADSVHDFAWAADNRYIHDIFFWKDVVIHSLYIPEYKSRWEQVKYYANHMLDFYSDTYGKYPYKQFTIAQAGDGGMEYPNIIFNAGYSPGLVAHEGGHQWFYGILGNNETREAWLDEGFITYATQKTLVEKYGAHYINPAGLENILQPPGDEHGDYRNYWTLYKLGMEEPVLTHSDQFKEDMAYNFGTYQKGGMILPMLEYIIGKEAFDRTMRTYFEKWKFKHPKSLDFQRIAEKESGIKLNWFFDEWLRTTKTCDYSISGFSGEWIIIDGINKYRLNCTLDNKSDIIMPIDLMLTFKSGKNLKMIIPVDWHSKNEKDAITLKRWDWVDKSYSFVYDFEEEVISGEIDPSLRLKDLNRLNNTSGCLPKFDIYFIRPIQINPPIDSYWINYRPSIGYSISDGIKPGIMSWGGYLGNHFIQADYASKLCLWYGFKNNRIDYELGFSLPVSGFGNIAYLDFNYFKMNGLRNISIEFSKLIDPINLSVPTEQLVILKFNHSKLIENDLPVHKMDWEKGNLNTLELNYYLKNSFSQFKLNSEVSFNSIIDYSRVSLLFITSLNRNLSNLRFFAGFTSTLPPIQKQFNLSSGNPIDQFDNSLYRDLTLIDKNLPKDINFTFEGGGNLRGYYDYYNELYGRNILALNLEGLNVSLSSLVGQNIPLISIINSGVFFDLGNIWKNDFKDSRDFINNFKSDAGIYFEIPQLNNKSITTILPFLDAMILRFNVPFWLSNPGINEKQFDFRWNISLAKVLF